MGVDSIWNNETNETLISGGDIDETVHKAASPELSDKYWKLNDCETRGCRFAWDHKLPTNYVFHSEGLTDKHDNSLIDC